MQTPGNRLRETILATIGDDTASAYDTLGRHRVADISTDDVYSAVLDLPKITVCEASSPSSADFSVGELLGEGGMGRVQRATQHALGRDVAIKQLLESRKNPSDVATLLREARLTGRLEHPSIIPIHWIGYCEDVGPVVVMKRVRGRAWRDTLATTDRSDENAFATQVETLIRVCDAIDYAHSQGVIHRDIKPSNVMLGDFGEVYVVDWGIAIDLESWEPDGRAAGTPAYMAPEMIGGEGMRPDRRSDVYLLGATLYEILFGHPPHQHDSAVEALMSANRELRFPADHGVPGELVDICRRACQVDPDARFQSVAELRRALREYMEHRSAAHLAAVAHDQLAAILRALDAPEPDYSALLEEISAVKHQCLSALDLWAENSRAEEGLEAVVEPAMRCHLALGNLPAARQLRLQATHRLDPELMRRLRVLERERALEGRARRRFEELQRDRSLELGRAQGRTLALAVVVVVLGTAISVFTHRGGLTPGSPKLLFGLGLVCSVIWAALLIILRKRLVATYINRTTTLAITACFLFVTTHRGLALLAGYDSYAIIPQDLLLMAVPLLVLGTLHRRFYLVSAVSVGAAALSIMVPDTSRILINLVPIILAGGIYDLWTRLAVSDHTFVERVRLPTGRLTPFTGPVVDPVDPADPTDRA